jgi:hypothetical protein
VSDAPIDGLIRKMLSGRGHDSSEHCVNENLMAAYLETSLSPKEAAEFESHVSDCAICREALAIAIRMGGQEEPGVISAEPGRIRFRFFKLVPIAGVLILLIALIPTFYKLKSTHRQNESLIKTQEAELRSPAKTIQKNELTKPEVERVAVKSKTVKETGIQSTDAKKPVESKLLDYRKAESSRPEALQKELTLPDAVKITEKDADLPLKPVQDEKADDAKQVEKTMAAATAPSSLTQLDVGRFTALNSVPPTVSNTLPPPGMLIGSGKDAGETKKIGDKEFYLNSGIWIDRQCAEHRDILVIEILPVVPEHETILKQYPALRNLLPAMVYWNGKIYLLR